MDANAAAAAWVEAWERGWRSHDADVIAARYAEDAAYRSHPFREPERSARDYALRAFAEEDESDCLFAEPVVDGDRAAVEWWAAIRSRGSEYTLAGDTLLRFDEAGLVLEHTDYWAQDDVSREPIWRIRSRATP